MEDTMEEENGREAKLKAEITRWLVFFGVAIMLSASISVLTPFEPSCILVYGPGKYRFSDFLKVGGGLTVICLALILWLVPIFWPLT